MSVLSDKSIKKMALNGMISPFEEKQIRNGKISYGLSSFGYDARVSSEFKIFTDVNSEIVDPKNFKSYSELKEKLDRVLGITTGIAEKEQPPFDGGQHYVKEEKETPATVTAESDNSEEFSYFAKLAEDN